MKLIYSPEGSPPQEFDFEPDQLTSLEAETIEELGTEAWDTYAAFGVKLLTGSVRARKVLLWTMLRRSNPKLKLTDVTFRLDELLIIVDDDDEEEPVGKDEPGDGSTASPSVTTA